MDIQRSKLAFKMIFCAHIGIEIHDITKYIQSLYACACHHKCAQMSAKYGYRLLDCRSYDSNYLYISLTNANLLFLKDNIKSLYDHVPNYTKYALFIYRYDITYYFSLRNHRDHTTEFVYITIASADNVFDLIYAIKCIPVHHVCDGKIYHCCDKRIKFCANRKQILSFFMAPLSHTAAD